MDVIDELNNKVKKLAQENEQLQQKVKKLEQENTQLREKLKTANYINHGFS